MKITKSTFWGHKASGTWWGQANVFGSGGIPQSPPTKGNPET